MIEGKDQAATTETMITGDMIPTVLLHPPPMARDLGAQVPTRDREENIDPAAGNMIEDINSHGNHNQTRVSTSVFQFSLLFL